MNKTQRPTANWIRTSFAALCAVLTMVIGVAAPAVASTSGVVISQVYGGGGNSGAPYTNDFVELYNAGASAVSLAGWSLQYSSATGTSWGSQLVNLSGSINPGQYKLVQLGSGGAAGVALPSADFSGTFNMSATAGKVALVNSSTALPAVTCPTNTSIVDLVGFGGTANCFETAPTAGPSATTAVLRATSGCTDNGNNSTDFTVGAPTPRNGASPLGSCGVVAQPIVPSCPSALTVASGAAIDFALSASDADSIVNAANIQSGGAPGLSLVNFSAAPATGGAARVKLALDGTAANGNFPVVVQFSNNSSQTATCTVNVTVGPVSGVFTPIYTIQGSGATSSFTGVRTTRGVVTKVNNNGYFIQDAVGDGDPATSDGIFVFTSTAPFVSAGQLVQITGTVVEFDTSGASGNPVAEANPVTEFTNLTATSFLGTGSITPTVITLPLAAQGGLERYEGMLVTISSPLTASQNFFQGRYGQVTLSAGGRLPKPTNVYRPGTAQALALADLNARNTIMLDDGNSAQNPNPTPYLGADSTLRAGDTLPGGITGVIDYGLATSSATGLALYRIHPTAAPVLTRANARPTTLPAVGGNVKVASFNVLNFFTTFSNGVNAAGQTGQTCTQGGSTPAASICRGADNLPEFIRQRDKIVQAMATINADVFGLMEIQNNGDVAVQNLVTALNAVPGTGPYAVVPLPPTTGDDAIRVAMIYKPSALTLSGASLSDANAINNRPPFAQAFSVNGQKFSVIVNHMKSKSCSGAAGVDADTGDGQGCFNDRRKQQATALLGFISTVQQATASNDVVVIGDLNAYAQEDPIDALTSGGLINQVSRFNTSNYSYVFDGEAGYIDHGLATPSASAKIAGATHWHINADEPSIIDYNTEFKFPDTACGGACPPDLYQANAYRASDHDPVIIGLSLLATPLSQTITFPALTDRALNAGSFTPAATASSGLTVSFSTTTPGVCAVNGTGQVDLLAVGLCALVANQGGNATYAAAPAVARSFNITAGALSQTISFGPLGNVALGSAPFALAATASSGLAVAFSSLTPAVCTAAGNTVSVVALGTCTIAASQAGNGSYLPATQVTQSFTVTSGGGTAEGDVPTLPEWGAILLGLSLVASGLRRKQP